MELHSSLTAALADTHRRDLLVEAEHFRTARHVRAAVRAARAVASLRRVPPAPEPALVERNGAADRRYAVSR